MSKFRISKGKLEEVVRQFEAIAGNVYPDIATYAKTNTLSVSYVGDLYDEVRRALKRGDISTKSEVMEFFLRTSKREAMLLDKAKMNNIPTK